MKEIDEVISRLDLRIKSSSILSNLLQDYTNCSADYNRYLNQGYTQEEVQLGYDIINLYIKIKEQYLNSINT